jgi:hypothetical protein
MYTLIHYRYWNLRVKADSIVAVGARREEEEDAARHAHGAPALGDQARRLRSVHC